MQPLPQQIGPYRILDELGRGGMAVVYRAVDTRTQAVIALKVLPPHLAHDEKYLHRFLREGKHAARLNHPNIVRIYETGSADGYYYMSMYFVDGPTLTDYLRSRSTLMPTGDIVPILRQVADGLDYAHNLGFLHRDIKPSNVLLDKQGKALLTDFGVAKMIDDDMTAYTVVGSTVGTPAFMSPEQARGEHDIDRRADIYSLGVIAYTMLTGAMPFKADSQPALLHKIVYEAPVSAEQFNPNIPPGMLYALTKVLAKSPSLRYNTAGEFAEALARGQTWVPSTGEWRAIRGRLAAPTPSQVEVAVLPEYTPAARRGNRGWVALLLSLCVLVGAFYLLLNPPPWLEPLVRPGLAANVTADTGTAGSGPVDTGAPAAPPPTDTPPATATPAPATPEPTGLAADPLASATVQAPAALLALTEAPAANPGATATGEPVTGEPATPLLGLPTPTPPATPDLNATLTVVAALLQDLNPTAQATQPDATATPEPVTPLPTSTPVPTWTPVPTAIPTATNTATATPDAVATATADAARLDLAVKQTLTAMPTATPTVTPTRTPRPTSTPVPTSTPRPTATRTPLPSATPTPSPTATLRPTSTPMPPNTPDLNATLTAVAAQLTRLVETPTPDLNATLTAVAVELTRIAPTPTPNLNATLTAVAAEMTRLAPTPKP